MHEYSVAYDIFKTAARAAHENNAREVFVVHVDFGELAMINPEQVVFLWETMREEEPVLAKANLKYRLVPAKTRCRCGYEGNEKFVCPDCGNLPEVLEGREICVTNLEIEVDEE